MTDYKKLTDEDLKENLMERVTTCPKCGKKYKKVDKHTWEPDCDCHDKPIQVCIGDLENGR